MTGLRTAAVCKMGFTFIPENHFNLLTKLSCSINFLTLEFRLNVLSIPTLLAQKYLHLKFNRYSSKFGNIHVTLN